MKKTAEVTCDLIANKIASRITNVSKNSQQNNSETVKNQHDEEIPKDIYVSPAKRQKMIDDLRLIYLYDNGISNINKFVGQYTKSTI